MKIKKVFYLFFFFLFIYLFINYFFITSKELGNDFLLLGFNPTVDFRFFRNSEEDREAFLLRCILVLFDKVFSDE